jgi:hypothetical protein
LKYEAWAAALPPSDPKRDFILSGIKNGFKITSKAYHGPPVFMSNYKSATEPATRPAVEKQIKEEIANGRYIIVQKRPTIVSALGAIPKDNNKIRLIHDCSRPHGQAVNDFATIEKFLFQSVKDAMELLTPGCYLAKVALVSAYRSVGIHPSDYDFAGVSLTFSGDHHPSFMFDSRLVFGAGRSPGIFNELNQAVCRMMHDKGYHCVIRRLSNYI